MATVVRKTRLVNPARRRKNGPSRRRRRNLSAKQIKFFGTPAQKAALKRKRRRNAAPPAAHQRAHRKRTRPSRSSHRRRRARTNPGEIITFGLAGLSNPAKRRKSVAKSKKSTRRRRRSNPVHRAQSRRRTNASFAPKRHRRRRHNNAPRRRRRNPESVSSITSTVMKAGWAVGGAVGTRMLTQLALQSNNTGIVGYIANAVAAVGLGWAGKKFLNAPGDMITIGGFIGLILRVIEEQTPFGSLLQSAGMSGLGDVGIYGATTFFVPLAEAGGADRGALALPGVLQNLLTAGAAAQAATTSGKGGRRAIAPAAAPPNPGQASNGGVGRYGAAGRFN